MLTLEKSERSTVVVSMFRKGSDTSKRPPQTVYFSHDVVKENQNTAEAAAVLDLHRTFLKKKNQINEEDFKEICDLIDDDAEPDQHDYLRPAFWDVRDHFDRYLQREMWLGNDADLEFRLEFPRKKDDWGC